VKRLLVIQYLSIDVCLGAAASAYFAGHLLHAGLNFYFYISLILAVYGIYNIDHFFDSRSSQEMPDERRKFHKRHALFLFSTSTAALSLSPAVAFSFFPAPAIFAGFVLGFFMILYMALVYFRVSTLAKEILAASGFTAGVWLMPLAWGGRINPTLILPVAGIFFLACLLNLYGYALSDNAADSALGQSSMAIYVSNRFTAALNHILLATGLILFAVGIWENGLRRPLVLVFIHFVSQYVLTVLFFFGTSPRFVRLAGEMTFLIFFLPAFLKDIPV